MIPRKRTPTWTQARNKAVLDNSSARLDQEFPLALPPLLQLLRCGMQLLSDQVVEHDDIRARCDRLVALLQRLALDVQQREARDSPDRFDSVRDGA